MERLRFPNSEHRKIRCSAPIQAELRKIAARIAGSADLRAGDPDGYGTDLTVGTDRARAHVWPQTRKARNSEAKHAHLMGIMGDRGL